MSFEPIDDNTSVWLDGKPAYAPRPALEEDCIADIAIIGGGFTGVSTAFHLAKRFPDRRIVLCEAKTLANGASGRNGGLLLNWVNGVHSTDPHHAKAIFDATQEGMATVEALARECETPVSYRRDGVLEVFTSPRKAAAAARDVTALNGVGIPLRWLGKDELPSAIDLDGAVGAVFDPTGGELDGAALVRGLRPVLEKLGVAVYESTPVLEIKEGATVRLRTEKGTVSAKTVVLATNAYTPSLGYFSSGICAVQSHLIATEPLPAARWNEIGWNGGAGFSDDLDRVAYASMTKEGRLVFGGGSNASYGYRFGNRAVIGTVHPRSYDAVHATMLRYLPRARDVRITHRWSGAVALTLSRACSMGVTGSHRNILYSLGYSGHGITLANLAGRVITDIYAGEDARWRALPFFEQRLSYIPPEPFRWVGYHVFTKLTGRSPRQTLPANAGSSLRLPAPKGNLS